MTTEPLIGQFEIRGLDEAQRDLRKLGTTTKESGAAAKGAGTDWGSFADKITASVVTVRAAYDAISGLVEGVREMADEFERQAGVINRFSGDITEASGRVNGLISDIDLMVQRNKASQAGLSITSEQFATLAVRASEWAAATGQDATEAFDRLMQSVATGEEGPLKELGVSLEGLTTTQQRQERALISLTEGYEDAESKADSFGGRMEALSTSLDNAETEIIGVLEQSGLLDQALQNLTDTTHDLIGEFSVFGDGGSGPISDLEMFTLAGAATLTAFTEKIQETIDNARRLGAAFSALARGDFAAITQAANDLRDAAESTTSFGDRVNELMTEGAINIANERGAAEGAAAGRASAGGGSGGGRGGQGRDTLGPAPGEGLDYDMMIALGEVRREQDQEAEDRAVRRIELYGEEYDAMMKRVDAAIELQGAEMDAAAQRQLDKEQMAAKEAAFAEDAAAAQAEFEANTRKSYVAMTSLNKVGDLFVKSILTAVEGQENLGQAMLSMLDEWSKQFALQETYKGIAALAEAVGNAIMNQPHAGAKFSEAAMHFGLAAVLGGVSAAIPNQGGGGGGGGAAAQQPPPSNGGGGGGTVVVNYNAPVAEPLLGRQQKRHQRAAENRFR